METKLSSATKEVVMGDGLPTVLIGERINPAGKKKMAEALRAGNLELVQKEALSQVQAGADVIDINVTLFGMDEMSLLTQTVQAVMEIVDVPLCFDSPNPKALEAALKVYKGKALLNSVTGEKHSLEIVLPLVKEFRAVVIGMTQDEEGIPGNSERRLAIAKKITEKAEAMGIPREDVIFDCLTSAVGADGRSGLVTLETIRKVKSELGMNLTLGASNISFGLPDRELLNNAFVAVAVGAGVNSLIVDVAKIRPIVLGTDLLLNHDNRARRYIEAYRQRQSKS
jgi:5-methyltetrahydrofolate--homocysteine methyltransferase